MTYKDKLTQLLRSQLSTAQLASKWMPRPTGKHKLNANKIRKALGMSPKDYRQLIARLSNTVEQKMCAGEWDQIDFNTVPSIASARYQKAFGAKATETYAKYIEALEKGEAKVNASAIFPHDVVKGHNNGNKQVASAQWSALPNYMEGSNERILPVIDVSGSMGCAAGSGETTCMDVAVSLGLYLAERQTGIFQDQFITFSERPQMQKVTGTLTERLKQIRSADWGRSTNLESIFDLIINKATEFGVTEDQMPTKIIIFSDMEFNAAIHQNLSAMTLIEQKYKNAKYKIPQVVFWNLNAHQGNVPVAAGKNGAALVSGFSPAILTSLLGDDTFTPEGIMLKTVMKARYDL